METLKHTKTIFSHYNLLDDDDDDEDDDDDDVSDDWDGDYEQLSLWWWYGMEWRFTIMIILGIVALWVDYGKWIVKVS